MAIGYDPFRNLELKVDDFGIERLEKSGDIYLVKESHIISHFTSKELLRMGIDPTKPDEFRMYNLHIQLKLLNEFYERSLLVAMASGDSSIISLSSCYPYRFIAVFNSHTMVNEHTPTHMISISFSEEDYKKFIKMPHKKLGYETDFSFEEK